MENLQAALDATNKKLDELGTTLDTELSEINTELKRVADGNGVSGAAVEGLAAISARIDGLKDRVSGLVTPTSTDPGPVPGEDTGENTEPVEQ